MAEKTKRPRKKHSAFEEAFALTLRTTFAQVENSEIDTSATLEEPVESPVSSGAPISVTPVAMPHVVTTEDSVENKHTNCADEVSTRNEQTKCTDEVSTRSEQTKCADEVPTTSDTPTTLEEPVDPPVSSDAPISETPVAMSHAVTTEDKVENKHPNCVHEVNRRNEQTKCADETNRRSEQVKCADEVRTTSDTPTTLQEPVDPPVSSDDPISETPVAMSHVVTTEECVKDEHTNCTHEVSTRSEHTKYIDEIDIRSEHSKCTHEINTRNEQTKCANEVNTRNAHSNKLLPPSSQQPIFHANTLPKIHLQKSLIESKAEQTLISYLHVNGDHISSYALISQETGITVGTLRRCFKKFIEYGLISTSKYCGRGKMQGIIITICNLQAAIDNVQIMHRSSAKQLALYESNIPVAATEQKFELAPSPIISTKKEIEKQPLTEATQEKTSQEQSAPIMHWLRHLNDTDIANFWPALSAVHFGTKQIHQALATLQAQGKVFDQQFGEDFKQGLDHADFALGNNGGIKDRHGRTVSKPCNYIYRSLAKDGYYAAPENYISPQAQRANDEATRLAKERAAVESLEKELEHKVTSTIDQDLIVLLEQGEANPLYCQLRDGLPGIARQGEENRSAHFKRAMNLALKEYMQKKV